MRKDIRSFTVGCMWLLGGLLIELALPSVAVARLDSKFGASQSDRGRHRFRQDLLLPKKRNSRTFWMSNYREACIPDTSQLLENHEGRHECAYDHSNGFRAIGVGYNLDDDVDTRRTELSTLFLDYDKVYKKESCLWDIQISLLLAFDTKRDLDNAAKVVRPLENFCCPVMAVFADIQHSLNDSSSFPFKDIQVFIEKAAADEWKSAGQELNQTNWCSNNLARCGDNIAIVSSGCNSLLRTST